MSSMLQTRIARVTVLAVSDYDLQVMFIFEYLSPHNRFLRIDIQLTFKML